MTVNPPFGRNRWPIQALGIYRFSASVNYLATRLAQLLALADALAVDVSGLPWKAGDGKSIPIAEFGSSYNLV